MISDPISQRWRRKNTAGGTGPPTPVCRRAAYARYGRDPSDPPRGRRRPRVVRRRPRPRAGGVLHGGLSELRSDRADTGNVARTTDAAVGLVDPGEDLSLLERFEVTPVPTLVIFVDSEAVASRAEGFPRTEGAVEFLREHAEESR